MTLSYPDTLREWSEATGGDNLSLAAWAELRKDLLREECRELCEAIDIFVDTGNAHPMAKEAADVEYVLNGAMLRPGINLDAAFFEVHRSNMTKIAPDGSFEVRPDGKILKGPHYEPPDMSVAFTWPEPPAEHPVMAWLDKLESAIRSIPLVTRLILILTFAGAFGMCYMALIFTIASGR